MQAIKYRSLRQLTIALLLSVTTTVTACSDDAQQLVKQEESIRIALLQTQAEEVPKYTITSGAVISDKRIAIRSRLSGYIRHIAVREGSRVAAGDVLFRVDPVDVVQAAKQARADLLDAEANLARYRPLLAEKAVSNQEFDRVQLRYTLAKSKLAQAENQLQYAEVRAPVSGTVVNKHLNAGDLASPGATVVTLENADQLSVKTYVSEKFIALIHEGDKAGVELASLKQVLSATIRQVVPAADPLTHQFLVKLALPVNKAIRPGMFAEVRFTTGTRTTLLLPRQAIVERNGLHAVYVADADNRLHYRLIRIGRSFDGRVEVLAGLQAGERIAADVQSGMRSGMIVSGA